jgi:hypothetical protein
MWLKPDEFYEMDVDEYPLLQRARFNLMQTSEGVLRRAALIIGSASYQGRNKDFQEWFQQAWPYGDETVHEQIDERISRLRKQAKDEVDFLNKHAARIQEVVAAKRKAQSIGN